MPFLFKPQRTRYVHPRTGKQVSKDTPGAERRAVEDPDWHARGIPGYPKTRAFRLCRDKGAAQKKLDLLVRKAERKIYGVTTPDEEYAFQPIAEHLAAYETELLSRRGTARHVALTLARLREVFSACGFERLIQLEAARLTNVLAERQQAKPPKDKLPAGQEEFTRQQMAQLLDVDPKTVSGHLERLGLAWEKDGREVVFPRATAEVLFAQVSQGLSPQTANHYLQAARSFGLWCYHTERLERNPFARCRAWRISDDQRHARRSLLFEEAEKLLTATQNSKRRFRGLTGPQRALLYSTILGTGFRVQEVASLTTASLHLDGERAAIVLAGKRAKNRKQAWQQIPGTLAESLRQYVQGRQANQPLWPGAWPSVAAKMLRRDLAEAGIPYVVNGPDGPLYADMHALRHTYCSWLDQAGLSLKQIVQLLRVSDPKLATNRYGMAQGAELSEAVNRVPLPLKPEPIKEPEQPTDGKQ